MELSECCNAEVITRESMHDEPWELKSYWHECAACGEACDIKVEPEPTHRIKLKGIIVYGMGDKVAVYEASANSQLQAIVREIFEKLEALEIDLSFKHLAPVVWVKNIKALKSEYLAVGEEK